MNSKITVVVADTNIWRDLGAGGLIDRLFQLPYDFVVPNTLFDQELKHYHWADIVPEYANIEKLSGDEVSRAAVLKKVDHVKDGKEPGIIDCMCLAIAESRNWALVTNDRRLRNVAKTTSVTVKTTVWIFKELLKHKIIDAKRAEDALADMKAENRWVPYSVLQKLVDDYK